jgi:hypothetical protein
MKDKTILPKLKVGKKLKKELKQLPSGKACQS